MICPQANDTLIKMIFLLACTWLSSFAHDGCGTALTHCSVILFHGTKRDAFRKQMSYCNYLKSIVFVSRAFLFLGVSKQVRGIGMLVTAGKWMTQSFLFPYSEPGLWVQKAAFCAFMFSP